MQRIAEYAKQNIPKAHELDNDDNLIQTSDLNKSIVLETQELMEFLTNKPKQDPGFTFI